MLKAKYKYNRENAEFERQHLTKGQYAMRVALWILPSMVLGLALVFVLSSKQRSTTPNPKESELAIYQKELKRLNANLNLMDRVLDDLQQRDEDVYRIALSVEEFPTNLRKMGTGGSDRFAYLDSYSNAKLLKKTALKVVELEQRLKAQSLSFRQLLKTAKGKEAYFAHLPSIQPVSNSDLKRIASGYGYRMDPVYNIEKLHEGIDFSAKVGTPVYATADGTVEYVRTAKEGYGKSIMINHGMGFKTRYGHLSKFVVKRGEKVKRGQLIALVGNTGKSTGPHLHYEVHVKGNPVNPVNYFHSDLNAKQYNALVERCKLSHKSLD
jgi:murein DD-endopeptidase MepM/ murein hydrolase activator NlpD